MATLSNRCLVLVVFVICGMHVLVSLSAIAQDGVAVLQLTVDTDNPYGPMGASRSRMVGFLAEPVFIVVFFTVSFVAGSTAEGGGAVAFPRVTLF